MYHNIMRTLSTSMTKNNYRLMFDGGSRGNPGICGAGAVLYKNNKENIVEYKIYKSLLKKK